MAAEETKHYLANGAAEKPAPKETLEWAGQTQAQRRRGLGLQGEVCQDVPHERLVGEQPAERRPVPGVVDRLQESRRVVFV